MADESFVRSTELKPDVRMEMVCQKKIKNIIKKEKKEKKRNLISEHESECTGHR